MRPVLQMRHKPRFCRQRIFRSGEKNINYEQKISRKWGEKPHFRLIFGRSDRIRTCGIDVPNAKILIFCVILQAFRGFCVRIDCFRVLFAALNPGSPKP